MKVDTYKCDVCGTVKGESNHWFRIDTSGNGLELHPWGASPATGTTVDLCSDMCVIKTVQQWLTARAQGHTHPGTEFVSGAAVAMAKPQLVA